jgi:hypothetical protein
VAGGLNTGAMGSFLSGNAATATGAATSGLFGAGGKMSFGGGLAFGGIVAGLGMVANGLFDLDGSSAAAAEALKRLRVQMKEFENDMQVRVMRSQGDIKAADLKAFTDKQAAERQQYADDLKKINLEWMYTNAGRTISTRANETNIQKNKELLSELDKQQAILLEAFKKNQEAGNIALQMREAELSQGKESAAYLKLLNYQRELELLNMDKADQAIQKRIWALEDEKTAIESTNKSISKTVDVALSAVNAIRDIQGGSLSIDSPEERYRKAKQAWLSATPDKAGEYGKAFLTASQGYNASGAGYQADYASVMGKLQSYAGMTGSTTAEQQLTVLGEIRDAVQDNKELKVQNKILLALLNVSQNIAETSSVTSGAATTTAQKASLKAAA